MIQKGKCITRQGNGIASLSAACGVMLQTKETSIVRNFIAILLFTMYASTSSAEVANCEITIEEVNARTTYEIKHSFTFIPNPDWAQRKNFQLPGYEHTCTLAFFDFDLGTMMSCELDETGHHFVQSDRSGISNDNTRNHLTFRYKSEFFVLEPICN